MAIIDLTIENPAYKRTEVTEAGEGEAATATEAIEPGSDVESAEAESRGRLRRTLGVTGALAVGALGLLTLRRFRGRRKNAEVETPEEDIEEESA